MEIPYGHCYDYRLHLVAALFPPMSDADYQKLREDIKEHGQAAPIIVDGGVLIDGSNRLRACKELGIEPWVRPWQAERTQYGGDNGQTDAEAIANYIWAKNVLRRHLTDDQRAALVLQFMDTVKSLAKEAQKRKQESVLENSPKQKPVHTRELLAEKAQVSEHKIRQVELVLRELPELLPKVESGKLKLKDAAKQADLQGEDDHQAEAPMSDADAEAMIDASLAEGTARAVKRIMENLNRNIREAYGAVDRPQFHRERRRGWRRSPPGCAANLRSSTWNR
jgi:predicted metal-dependent HD superfamily phosphohydrolase